MEYLHLCEALGLQPEQVPADLPQSYCLSEKSIRKLFMSDVQHRQQEVNSCLAREKGGDILAIDWTKDAAAQCGANFLLAVMDGAGHILLSTLTENSSPKEAEPHLLDLQARGVCPKVAYVDDGCCSTWLSVLSNIWPGFLLRMLRGM